MALTLPFARCLFRFCLCVCAVQKNGVSIWSLTTRYASVKHAYPLFSPRTVKGLDAYHYTVQELKHCIVHYSVSEFILSEINQELVVRIAGLTGSQGTHRHNARSTAALQSEPRHRSGLTPMVSVTVCLGVPRDVHQQAFFR